MTTAPSWPVLTLGGAVLALIALSGWQRQQVTEAQTSAADLREFARVAAKAEGQAKDQAQESGALAARYLGERDTLQARLDALPQDSGPRPVDPGTSSQAAITDLAGMGLHPAPLADPLACGLTLPDALTTIHWGREAQRVGPLAARLEASIALARAQEGATGALLQQVAGLTTALGEADTRATAQERRADQLDHALKAQGSPRNWTAGALLGLDTDGRKHLGAYVSWSYKAVDFHALTINNTAALGAGFRF